MNKRVWGHGWTLVVAGLAMATLATGAPPATAATTTGAPAVASVTPHALFGSFHGYNAPLYFAVNPYNAINAWLPSALGGPGGAGSYIWDMQAWQGRRDDVISVYSGWNDDPKLFNYALPLIWNTYHAIPSITWNGEADGSVIAAGGQDFYITQWAQKMKEFIFGTVDGQPAPPGGRRVFMRWNWEANASWYQHSPAWNNPDCATLEARENSFVAGWRYLHDKIMQVAGLTNANMAWIFSVYDQNVGVPANCPNNASDIVAKIFPGDAYVDWVGVDGYGFFSSPSPAAELGAMVDKLRTLSNRPMSINEVSGGTQQATVTEPATGHDVRATPAQKGQWITDYLAFVKAKDIRMSVWFNVDIQQQDWAVFSENGPADPMSRGTCTYTSATSISTTYNTYCEYKDMVNDPWFIEPDLSNPRLVTDAEFLGTAA